jgi:hypothetical protein
MSSTNNNVYIERRVNVLESLGPSSTDQKVALLKELQSLFAGGDKQGLSKHFFFQSKDLIIFSSERSNRNPAPNKLCQVLQDESFWFA